MQLQKEVKSNPKQPSCKKRVQPQKGHCGKDACHTLDTFDTLMTSGIFSYCVV